MATPLYNTSWRGGREGRPRPSGAGQPEADSDGSLGSGTPAYLAAPPPTNVTQDAATAPQPKQVAIVVPRT